MANGNLTKKEPKIVERDHKSLKRAKNHQKGLKIVKNSHKWSKRAKNRRKGPKKHKFGL